MNNIPIIGEKPKQLSTTINVLTNDDMVAVSIMAPMTIEVAAQVVINLGNAIEKARPGSLIPLLSQWLSELQGLEAKGQEVLRDLKLA